MGLRRQQNQVLLLLLLLLLAAKSISGQSLQGGYHTCSKDQEGTYVKTKISGGIVAHCKCVRGILDACQISGASCEKNLKGCYYVEKNQKSICQSVCKGCQANINGNLTKIESGTTWRDGEDDPCLKSHCFSGVITKSQVQCPPSNCANPVKRPGQCCPTCPSESASRPGRNARCMRARLPFKIGETKADPLDPCVECSCEKSGNLTCERRACPVLPCPSRLQHTEKGQCCPTCIRRHDSDSNTFGDRCFFQNQLYYPGQSFSPDNCTNCTCKAGGAASCFRQTCPALPCSESEQVRDENSCCPVCPNAAFTSTRILPATRPDHCEHGGVRYADGATWSDQCANCSCAGGEIQCAKKKCPRLICPGSSRVMGPLEGKCCPECQSITKEGVCTVFGDPHYRTFDGSIFNFQGSCKYLLASDCQHGVSNGMSSNKTVPGRPSFSIRITNDARNSMAFSWLRTVTVRLESGDKITLMQNMKVKVNGVRVKLPHLQLGAFSIMRDGGYTIILRLPHGIKLLWDGVSFLELTVPPKYQNRLCGLCGNFNGDKNDDFYGRDGGVHPDGQSFGDTWRVGGTRACSVLPRDMPKSYEPNCSQSWESKIKSDRNCNALNSPLFHSCRALVDSGYYYNACRLDMCECPNNNCHCEVLTAYARKCERAGVVVPNWREATGCQNVSSFQWSNRGKGFHNSLPSNSTSDDDDNDVDQTILNEVSPVLPSTGKSESTTDIAKKSHSALPLPYATLYGAAPVEKEQKKEEEEDRIGEFLPGCTLENAKFCKQGRVSKGSRRRQKNNNNRLTKAERKELRRLRRKERRRKRRQMKKIKEDLMRSSRRKKKRRPKNGRRKGNSKKSSTGGRRRGKIPESFLAFSSMVESQNVDEKQKQPKSLSTSETEDEEQETELLLGGRDYSELVAVARSRMSRPRSRKPLPLRDDGGLRAEGGNNKRVLTKRDFKRRRRRRRRRRRKNKKRRD